MASHDPVRLLVFAAHPDDAELQAGGLISRCAARGDVIKIVSVTNGAAGHHRHTPEDLARIRREEAAAAGTAVGAEYVTWDFPDARLEPSLNVRGRVIREMREFAPDLVLTHRTCDYHPDHRAVGQAVQDASYLVTVPLVEAGAPALRVAPIVAYMADAFTRPNPLRPDVVLDVSEHVDTVLRMLACHRSQVFEFLAYNWQIPEAVPDDDEQRHEWLRTFLLRAVGARVEQLRPVLAARVGVQLAARAQLIEAYEISEYASLPDGNDRERLFPTR